MKIVRSQTMQEMDRRAMDEFGIPGLELMEHAGRCCVEEIIRHFGRQGVRRVLILAGKGNNGGDGHVIARLLLGEGWKVTLLVLAEQEQITGDAAVNLKRLPPDLPLFRTREGELTTLHATDIRQTDLIVDAMLGTGLSSDLAGVYREAVQLVNGSGRPVVAVDIPSGVHGSSGRVLGSAVRADLTVTFACPKLGHVLYPGAERVGRLVVRDIGIPPSLLEQAPGFEYLNEESMAPLLKRRDRQGHKGDYGHCLFIAGSTGKSGAAALCANSAVRAGSGLVTLGAPETIHRILEVKTTEAMTVPLPDSGNGHLAESAFAGIVRLLEGRDVLAIGPGIDRQPDTVALVRSLAETVELPLVIDADGLNALATDMTVLKWKRSSAMVLTPHPGEMARMLGAPLPPEQADRIELCREFATSHDVHLVLKGARTIVASPDGSVAINGSGNPGMASGGMGDVLTGIIASLIGQGYDVRDACCLGVFIHGYAADMVAREKGEVGIIATDVAEMLPFARKRLLERNADPAFPHTQGSLK
jgi:NAD(P)H-hydrate epimerase